MSNLTPQELLDRRTGIGASECSAALGMNPWMTPLHVYLSKVGEYQAYDSAAKKSGRMLESVVAEMYLERTGHYPMLPKQKLQRHKDKPHIFASLDRVVSLPTGDHALEIKTARSKTEEWGEEGTDQVPKHYLLQVMQQMAVAGMDRADIAVLFSGQDLAIYTVYRNDRLIEKIFRALDIFWERVVQKDPPPPDWEHPETPALIQAIQTISPAKHIALHEDFSEMVRNVIQLKKLISDLEDSVETSKAMIVQAMGDAEFAALPGIEIRRRKIQRKGYTVPPSEHFTMTFKEVAADDKITNRSEGTDRLLAADHSESVVSETVVCGAAEKSLASKNNQTTLFADPEQP